MKPNFALTLSFEGIGLLHRAFPGWYLVGKIDLDNKDLLFDLNRLREKAVALDPAGLRSKLVIPNDQIKYLNFDPKGTKADDLPDLVAQELDGTTPYALSALVHDWVENDGTIWVAAVARETLKEAEAFAKEHKFNPVSFVAMPQSDVYPAEPFFGETSHFKERAEDGESVERDPVPVRVIGAAKLPEIDLSDGLVEPDGETPRDAGTVASEAGSEPDEVEAVPEVAGLSESGALYERPQPSGQSDADETEPKLDAVTFTSMRASRGGDPASAPRLDGVARHFTPVAVSAEVVSDSLPRDPDDEPDQEQAYDVNARGAIPPAPPEYAPEAPVDQAAFTTHRDAPIIAVPRPGHGASVAEEQQRMTIFGAREADPVGGKPKYLALILTAVLLVFLAGIAIWASVFLDDGLAGLLKDEPDIIIADMPADPAQNDAIETQPQAETETEIEGALREALSQPELSELTQDEVRARYAATGIWLVAPQIPQAPATDGLDDFYQTSIDGDVIIQDAVALPDMSALRPDERPDTPFSPARAGTTFALDERGLVIATRQGALSPDGILIYAGPPPVKPRAMPKREIVAEIVADAPDPAMLRLAGFRPRSRPADLSERNERENLSGRTLGELAGLRPRLRPRSVQQTTEEAVQQTATATTVQPFIDLDAVNSAVTEAVQTDVAFSGATAQAVAVSLKPNTRPSNFDRTVKRSKNSAEAAVAVSASQRVTPRIPSTSSVARQATQTNVLQMRKINLIGVYGSPSSRRALVRLSNGRYRKVKVGDRLDGGKVSAIGDSELRYQKSGRNMVLKMPRG